MTKIPDLEYTLRRYPGWSLSMMESKYDGYSEQRTRPVDRFLLKKLGLRTHDQVLFVAGFLGSWAKKIAASGVQVYFSDASRDIISLAQQGSENTLYKQILQVNYINYPDTQNCYDWTMTFEAVGPIEFIVFRALLNRKGGMYIVWDQGEHARRKLEKLKKASDTLSVVYGAYSNVQTLLIDSVDTKEGMRELRMHKVVRITSTKRVRELVRLDLDVIRLLQGYRTFDMEILASRKRVSCHLIKESIQRINILSSMFDNHIIRRVVVN